MLKNRKLTTTLLKTSDDPPSHEGHAEDINHISNSGEYVKVVKVKKKMKTSVPIAGMTKDDEIGIMKMKRLNTMKQDMYHLETLNVLDSHANTLKELEEKYFSEALVKQKWNEIRTQSHDASLWIFIFKEDGFEREANKREGARVLAVGDKLHLSGVVPEDAWKRCVGNGQETRFWDDCWLGNRPLRMVFPRLVVFDVNPTCMVEDRWLLGDFRLTDSSDGWRWEIASDGVFSVAETRRWIDNQVLPEGDISTRWCKVVPCKVNIFIWKLRLNILPTRFNLPGRGMEAETVDHVFWRCGVASDIWVAMFRWLQLPPGNFVHPGDLLVWVDGCRGSLNRGIVIEAVVIWRFRNDVVHESRKMRKEMFYVCVARHACDNRRAQKIVKIYMYEHRDDFDDYKMEIVKGSNIEFDERTLDVIPLMNPNDRLYR
ncbi:hypothetical protein LXL04_038981 [Taraxacum kok-saghyz]